MLSNMASKLLLYSLCLGLFSFVQANGDETSCRFQECPFGQVFNEILCECDDILCDVAILGGGIGGLYSAYHLNKQTSDLTICLFEKESLFGGRIYDVTNDIDPDNIYVPLGGIRLDEYHYEAIEWFNETNISIFWTEYDDQMFNTRSVFGLDADDILPAFPSLDPERTDEGEMYEIFMGDVEWDYGIPRIINNTKSELFEQFNSMNDYLRGLFGPEGYQYLVDAYRFRSDFTDIDVQSYIQFLHHEEEFSSYPPFIGYPEGGLSEVVRRTVDILENSPNVHLFLDAEITRIYSDYDDIIVVIDNEYQFMADFVIINIDPSSFKYISGDIAEEIKQQKPFKDSKPMPVSVISGIYDNKWWEDIEIDRIPNGDNVRRITTTDNCINHMEMPINPYQRTGDLGRVRLVYSDGHCALYWKTLFDTNNLDKIQDEIQRSLQYLFGSNIEVPLALNISYQFWENGWHFQEPHAMLDIYQLEEWALNPIQNRNQFALVNEAWGIHKAWIIASIRSSQKTLRYHFDLEFTEFGRKEHQHRDFNIDGPTNR